jgi:hypothetical protein
VVLESGASASACLSGFGLLLLTNLDTMNDDLGDGWLQIEHSYLRMYINILDPICCGPDLEDLRFQVRNVC